MNVVAAQPTKTKGITPARVACSPREFADATGVCIATVTNWIRDGRIKSYKIGARRLIPVTEVYRSGEVK